MYLKSNRIHLQCNPVPSYKADVTVSIAKGNPLRSYLRSSAVESEFIAFERRIWLKLDATQYQTQANDNCCSAIKPK